MNNIVCLPSWGINVWGQAKQSYNSELLIYTCTIYSTIKACGQTVHHTRVGKKNWNPLACASGQANYNITNNLRKVAKILSKIVHFKRLEADIKLLNIIIIIHFPQFMLFQGNLPLNRLCKTSAHMKSYGHLQLWLCVIIGQSSLLKHTTVHSLHFVLLY